jgi:hypothetical protein
VTLADYLFTQCLCVFSSCYVELLQAKSLPFEQQKQAVQQNLHSQLVNIGRSIHTCLVQVGPPAR